MPLPVRVCAPATTANLGPGFDCAGAALDLWNELEVIDAAGDAIEVVVSGEGADEVPRDASHLGVRAFPEDAEGLTWDDFSLAGAPQRIGRDAMLVFDRSEDA